MSDTPHPSDLRKIYQITRREVPHAAIPMLGSFVTGLVCNIVRDGYGLRACSSTSPLIHLKGTAASGAVAILPDPALNSLGVEIIHIPCQTSSLPDDAACVPGMVELENARRLAVASFAFRAGIIDRMLDIAFAHLSGRESGGEKILHQQLVKATITECHLHAQTILSQAPHLLVAGHEETLDLTETTLSRITAKAAKLMGGHGFLPGDCTPWRHCPCAP